MKVKLGLLVLAACVIGSVFLWQRSSFFKKAPDQKPAKQESQGDQQNLSYDPQESVKGIKDLVSQIEKDSTYRINNFIEEKKKEIVKQLLGDQKSEVKVTAIPIQAAEDQNGQRIVVVDLSRENNLLFSLKRGDKIYLVVKNTKAGQCIYINETKYNISEGQSLEVEFQSTGTFSIKTNFCDLNYSEHGRIIVE